jgi:chromatin structure-remodeling complex subunit RSC1/2
VFVRITNWDGCIPEEVRQDRQQQQGQSGEGGEFMPIYLFEKIIWPKKVGSPFLAGRGGAVKGMKGPGGIVNVPTSNGVEAGGGGDGDSARKKLRSDGNPGRTQQQQPPPPPPPATTTTIGIASSQNALAVPSHNPYQQLQQPHMQQSQLVAQVQSQRSTTLGPDRSIITAAGGIAAIGGPSQVEKLPAETGRFSYQIYLFILGLVRSFFFPSCPFL